MSTGDLRYQKKRRDHESLIQHLEKFKLEPHFITRPWTFNSASEYLPFQKLSLEQRLEVVKGLADYGLSGIELLFPQEIDEENLAELETFQQESHLRIVSVGIDFSLDPQFLNGALSSPVKKVREKAIELIKDALELNIELETDYALIILNAEGYESAFGADLTTARDRFATAIGEIVDNYPEIRLVFQPQPPRLHHRNFFHTTAEVILACQKIEALLTHPDHRAQLLNSHTIISMIPDLSCLPVLGEDPASSLSLLLEHARLAGVAINHFPHDSHWTTGSILDFDYLKYSFYMLKMAGYKEAFHLNVGSTAITPTQALKNMMDMIRAYTAFINYLEDDKIILTHLHPDKNQGWLEGYLTRIASIHQQALPPIPFFQI
ncbi:hypothetical protein JW964_01940 [candidate division KSB1 bacterium]|nr:hypothetical protein [candidate division KSB1 bacterium]